MSTSLRRSRGGRVYLGSPVLSVKSSGSYLRHRVAAERAYRARRRAARRRRLLLLLAAVIFYLLIGRELLRLATSHGSAVGVRVRADVQTFSKDVSRLTDRTRSAQTSLGVSPLTLTSAASLARLQDAANDEDSFSKQPIPASSRLP